MPSLGKEVSRQRSQALGAAVSSVGPRGSKEARLGKGQSARAVAAPSSQRPGVEGLGSSRAASVK